MVKLVRLSLLIGCCLYHHWTLDAQEMEFRFPAWIPKTRFQTQRPTPVEVHMHVLNAKGQENKCIVGCTV